MGIKTGLSVGVVGLMAAGGLALGGYVFVDQVLINPERAEVGGEATQVSLDSVAGYTPNPDIGDRVIPLSHTLKGGNTQLFWEVSKTLTGQRHTYAGTWDVLSGAIAFNPEGQAIKAIDVRILLASFIGAGSDHPAPTGLTNTVLKEEWFGQSSQSEAVFTATRIVPRAEAETAEDFAPPAGAPEGWTHLIDGTFSLKGTEAPLQIAAVATFEAESLKLDLGFSLSRATYSIHPESGEPSVPKIDDAITLHASVSGAPDAGAAISVLGEQLREQGSQIASQNKQISDLKGQLTRLTDAVTELERAVKLAAAQGGGSGAAPAPANLPEQFEEAIPGAINDAKAAMQLVKDPAGKVGPFYMQTTELSWDMFYNWAYSEGISEAEMAKLIEQDLRPTRLYDDSGQVSIGFGNRPAIGLSRLNADAFCKWLSEQTGRMYRLPTLAEWKLAVELGGGVPKDVASVGLFAENAELHDIEFIELTRPVTSGPANKLGFKNLIGNAAEWVSDKRDGASQIVGGHFMMSKDDFTLDWHAVEDQSVWNATYPQDPPSKWWYRDDFYQTLRLVCDPVNIPAP